MVIIFFILLSTITFARPLKVNAQGELQRLMQLMDKDLDQKITIEDGLLPASEFVLKTKTGPLPVKGTYFLSNLAQELRWSELKQTSLESESIFENPVERLSRNIRTRFWDGLTRTIDDKSLTEVLSDPKFPLPQKFLYVPAEDKSALAYYKKLSRKNVSVVSLPREGALKVIGNNHGLLTLGLKDGRPLPYVVPGGRFNEMYGWDSYFHLLGTLSDGRIDLARSMLENFIYEIEHYEKILNANRTYYLTRSQPPFLTSMAREVLKVLPPGQDRMELLKRSLRAAIKEYETVWMGRERLTETGLSRYAGFAEGIPPEVEPGHFDETLVPFTKKHKVDLKTLKQKFNSGELKDPELTAFFHQDRAVRESGHDTTYRWRVETQDRAADFVTVDLNSLLYKYELDLAAMLEEAGGSFENKNSEQFKAAAEKRKNLIRKYLWDPKEKMFFDYDFIRKKRSSYISATSFWPLWAGDILTKKEADDFIAHGLKKLEEAGGLAATSKDSVSLVKSKKEERQWDYPSGWAPHQILAWQGLLNYGHTELAQRLAYRWLFMITKNAMDFHGTIPEKYNVVTRSHKVFAEYGNVGTDFSYITVEGFGWMNASYQIGLKLLNDKRKEKLKELVSPESLFPNP